ncbi:MAG TPA: LuxR C-terminal-related transcriptional regulator [Candidatus Methylomirabilis sp.]|nr:LuxR C-terminal-related transcriptional regulator [Candidatus Methylomirabilis sp.]
MGLPEEATLDQALERAGDGAFVTAADGRIVLWNLAAERILGYSLREALGRPCCDLFVGPDHGGNRLCYKGCHVTTLVRMGEPIQNFDMRTRTKAGPPVWLNVSSIVIHGGNGSRGPRTLHLFRDVTATKELLNVVCERFSVPSPAPAETNGDLTRRELEILRLVAGGENTKAVAARLHVSPATVRNHVQNILGKLSVHSRLQAVAYATTHRLL